MCPPEQVADSYALVLDNNQTLHQQDANDDWIFFAEGNWDPAEADQFNGFDCFSVNLGV